MQPVVTLAADGQSGKGRWHIMAMLGGYERSASWAGGVYENQYVRENGVWKIKEVRYLPQYSGRYEDPGWTADARADPVPFRRGARRQADSRRARAPRAARAASRRRSPRWASAWPTSPRARSASATRSRSRISSTQYGYYVDRKMWDDVADLFAADGTMEIGLQGVYAGRTSIRRGLNAFGPPVSPRARSTITSTCRPS